MNYPEYTLDECMELIYKSFEAEDKGDTAEIERIRCLLPIPAHLADIAKKFHGIESLKESGLNLSLAVKEFGEQWLEN